MQFWLKHIVVLGFVASVVGCAGPEERVVDEDHQYLLSKEGKVIEVPQGLKQPVGDEDFVMPQTQGTGPLGEALDIRAPMQLLALASGSRLDTNNRANMIWFDQTSVVDNLTDFTWDAMRGFVDGAKISGSSFDTQKYTIETGWVNHVEEGSFWDIFGDPDLTTSYRYKMLLKMLPHGRTGYVAVFLMDHEVNGVRVPLSSLNPVDKSNAETAFLNEFVYHFQILQELRMDKVEVSRTTVITLSTGQNAKGSAAFHSANDVDTVWVDFRTLLENMAFTIDDVDRSVKKLYVTYQPEEKGFWDSLWGDDDTPEINLPKAEYVIQVTEDATTGQSYITWYDKDENPLPVSQYQAIEADMAAVAKRLGLSL